MVVEFTRFTTDPTRLVELQQRAHSLSRLIGVKVSERLNDHMRSRWLERLQAAKQASTKCHCLSLHACAEQGDADNLKMANFLTVGAKHCRKAEHSLQLVGAQRRSRLDGAAGSFNLLTM